MPQLSLRNLCFRLLERRCDMKLEESSFKSNPTMVTPDGNRVQIHFSELNDLLKELLPTVTLDAIPDRAEFENTGNQGTSLDKVIFELFS